ncbi:MAG: hypothetical protein LBB76_05625 [Azoarcus sp.]|nr:hypothetical protein [Azoarcus sp.]
MAFPEGAKRLHGVLEKPRAYCLSCHKRYLLPKALMPAPASGGNVSIAATVALPFYFSVYGFWVEPKQYSSRRRLENQTAIFSTIQHGQFRRNGSQFGVIIKMGGNMRSFDQRISNIIPNTTDIVQHMRRFSPV